MCGGEGGRRRRGKYGPWDFFKVFKGRGSYSKKLKLSIV